jgi:hypothetical protein
VPPRRLLRPLRHAVDAVSQSRTWSFIESWANVLVGFGVNFVANLVVLPLELARSGGQVTPGFAFRVGLWFTAISLVRSYVLRRVFEGVGR